MIRIGYDDGTKDRLVTRYCDEHGIRKVFVLSPARFRFACSTPHESIEWSELIMYQHYYRLLREVDDATLIVVNECLRTQNRHELTYNCIRLFLQQTEHRIVFQYLPIIETADDFMILFDFDTRSRWKRERFRPDLLAECDARLRPVSVEFVDVAVETDRKTRDAYAREKRKLIDGIGLKDPHAIPRNLLLLAGKAKLASVQPDRRYVGRNNRFALPNIETYRDVDVSGDRVVFEFCHNFIDFCDFLAVSRQSQVEALVSDLKVDRWYFDRYREWGKRLHETSAILPVEDNRP